MSLFDQPNLTSGIDDALITTSQSVTAFPVMILVFVYFIIVFGGSSAQKNKIGTPDIPFWSVLASLSIFFLGLIFTLGEGLISLKVLSVIMAFTILNGFWFFFSRVRGEE